jgi:putative FmdB family regulatory protein
MPIYQYRCDSCRNEFKKKVTSKTKETEITCPACGGDKLTKLTSRVSSSGKKGGPGISSSCGTGGG